jgi:hypothetical protein
MRQDKIGVVDGQRQRRLKIFSAAGKPWVAPATQTSKLFFCQ